MPIVANMVHSTAISIFLTTLTLVVTALLVHIVIWKVKLPSRQMKTLLGVFLSIYLLWAVFCFFAGVGVLPAAQVSLYYWSICLCYTITYSAIEGGSPTLSLMSFVNEAGTKGRSSEEVIGFMNKRPFIAARLAALRKSGLVRQEGDRIFVAGKGSMSFRLILGFRKLYGSIPKGG